MSVNGSENEGVIPPGLSILVAEDEMMLAMMFEDLLSALGCAVVKAARVAQAARLAATEKLDGAILDVNLAGEAIYPVAEQLRRRGIPFAFITGYGAGGLRADYRDWPMLAKPFHQHDLRRLVAEMFATRDPAK
jgi:DNA-binding response OmpR family regulator